MSSLERTRPRLKKICIRCNKKFLPKGTGRTERLCYECKDKLIEENKIKRRKMKALNPWTS